MPRYVFEHEKSGAMIELAMTMDELRARQKNGRIRHAGKMWTRNFSAEQSGMSLGDMWPQVSVSSGVAENQVAEANADAKRHGFSVRFDRRGDAHYPSAVEKRKYLKHIGMVDRESYF
jgi:hypothetical protein